MLVVVCESITYSGLPAGIDMGGDLLREGDDAHDRRDDDVHRVVLDRVGVDTSVLGQSFFVGLRQVV